MMWALMSVYVIGAIAFFLLGYSLGMDMVVRKISGIKYDSYVKGKNDGIEWEAQNVVVSRLMRVRYGPVVLSDGLRTGKCYELTAKELELLFEFAGLSAEKTNVIKG